MSNPHYSRLLREHIRQGDSSTDNTRKKRRLGTRESSTDPETRDESDGPQRSQIEQEDESELDSDEFEDVELDSGDKDGSVNIISEGEEDDQRDYSFLRSDMNETQNEDSMTINITRHEEPKPTKRKVNFIGKEERQYRVQMHQWTILTMMCHGVIRNRWCNDYGLLVSLREAISKDILDELQSIRRNKRMSVVNAVRFTDVVRELMFAYSRKFRVTKQGIVRRNWNELGILQSNTERNVTFERFKKLCLSFQGSRDIGIQSFVALARSLGMKARLVFSLQPPDFTMVTELPKIELKSKTLEPAQAETSRKPTNSKQAFLQKTRLNKTESEAYKFESSSFPIFWVEVWNKFNRKWLAVDPFNLRVVEQPPMRRKSAFEPPMSDSTNNLLYAIAFDAQGGVKDVTRRYAQQYNSRTVKKRISFKSDQHADWYDKVLQACSSSSRQRLTKVDILELKEFRDRDLAEGMPNNAAGFKDHPLYALESQLRQNEIISPMDNTTKCGAFRYKVSPKSKNTSLVPVYKRSAVHSLRSAKAWYLRGRVLKVGEQPLKIKQIKRKTSMNDSDDEYDDDSSQRLYAEYQTKLYVPPPLQEGVIPKNAFGNIDAYVPTMIPEGGHLIEITPQYPISLMERAAKILEIDYAKAIVAFDFGKKGRKVAPRVPQAREGGVVIHNDHTQAMMLVMSQLLEEVETEKRRQGELLALRSWKFLLTKLRINSRLDKQHGKVSRSGKSEQEYLKEESSSEYSVYSEDSDSSDGYKAGGFVPTSIDMGPGVGQGEKPEVEQPPEDSNGSEDYGGGFIAEPSPAPSSEGGFIVEPSDKTPDQESPRQAEPGGFLSNFATDSNNRAESGSTPPNDIQSDDDLMEIPPEHFVVQEDGELIYKPQSIEPLPEGSTNDSEESRAEFKAQNNPIFGDRHERDTGSASGANSPGVSSNGSISASDMDEVNGFEFDYSDDE